MSWAEDDTSMAIHTVLVTTFDSIVLFVVVVCIVATLVDADLTADASLIAALYDELWFYVALQAATNIGFTFFRVATTGSPPIGLQTLSSVGSIARMAASSEEI